MYRHSKGHHEKARRWDLSIFCFFYSGDISASAISAFAPSEVLRPNIVQFWFRGHGVEDHGQWNLVARRMLPHDDMPVPRKDSILLSLTVEAPRISSIVATEEIKLAVLRCYL
jgi:hypothetical protein